MAQPFWDSSPFLPPSRKRTLLILGTGNMGKKHWLNATLSPWWTVAGVGDLRRSSAEAAFGVIRRQNRDWDAGECRLFGRSDEEVATGPDLNALGAELVDEMFDETGADALLICTPNRTHHKYILAARRRGKWVGVEKPMTGTLQEAEEIADLDSRQSLGGTMVLYPRPWGLARWEIDLLTDRVGVADDMFAFWKRQHGIPPGDSFANVGPTLDIATHPFITAMWIRFQQTGVWPTPSFLTATYRWEWTDSRHNQWGPYAENREAPSSGYGQVSFRDGFTIRWEGAFVSPVAVAETLGVTGHGPGPNGFHHEMGTLLTPQRSYPLSITFEQDGRRYHDVVPLPQWERTEEALLRAELDHFAHLVSGLGQGCCESAGFQRPPHITSRHAADLHGIFAASDLAARARRPVEFEPGSSTKFHQI